MRNTSPTATRRVPIRRDLPAEIRTFDVLDAGGLEVGTDAATGAAYVFANNVEIGPNSTRIFDVAIRDKWNIHQPRIPVLRKAADDILAIVRAKEGYQSVDEALAGLLAELDKIEKEEGPTQLDGVYVAFYRRQGDRLDAVEEQLNRIESALKPIKKTSQLGFDVKPPSMKTTWALIYIILGFLAVVSLLFFFRWYGTSKAEQMGTGAGEDTRSGDGA